MRNGSKYLIVIIPFLGIIASLMSDSVQFSAIDLISIIIITIVVIIFFINMFNRMRKNKSSQVPGKIEQNPDGKR